MRSMVPQHGPAAWSGRSWAKLLHGLAGSGLVIAGALAMNQRLERRIDRAMARTAPRPLPSNRLTSAQVTWFAAVATAAGLVYLLLGVNVTIVLLAAGSWLWYVWVYTPLKAVSAWQTPIGAVAGAMPALLGGAVVDRPWSLPALALFSVVFFWQFPHAMAIAWLYRREFAKADLKVGPVVDPSGRLSRCSRWPAQCSWSPRACCPR